MIRPVLVKIDRKGPLLKQGCDVYIGHQWRKNGWDLPISEWYNPFRVLVHHKEGLIQQKYTDYLKKKPDLPARLETLSGKVLGCWCKNEGEANKSCHGDVILKLFDEQFPEAKKDPDLRQKYFYPDGKLEDPPQKKSRKRTADTQEKKTKAKKKKKNQAPQKVFRNQDSHPEGVRHCGNTVPWPQLDHPWNPYTVWLDEAGYGCWAGPLHIGATVLLDKFSVKGLIDSKTLKPHERDAAYQKLLYDQNILWHVESIPNTEIDEKGLGKAWQEGMRRAIEALKRRAWQEKKMEIKLAVVDGNKMVLNCPIEVKPVPKGDMEYAGVAAASILAKVSRDRKMTELAPRYPEFEELFREGKGYYHSARHQELINAGKITDIHRLSYKNIKQVVKKQVVKLQTPKMYRYCPPKIE